MSGQPSLTELTRRVLDEYPTPFELVLTFSGVRILVRCNREDVCRQLREYYASFQGSPALDFVHPELVVHAIDAPIPAFDIPWRGAPPSRGKHHVKETFLDLEGGRIVRKIRTGMQFLLGNSHRVAIGPVTSNVNQVVNFINNLYIGRRLQEGYLLGHAAALQRGRQGFAVAGPSGSGKSTLALRLMGEGADFVSNDRLLFRREEGRTRMLGVPKYPRVNPGTVLHDARLHHLLDADVLRELKTRKPEEIWGIEAKVDVPLERIYGSGRFRLEGVLSAVFLLTWSHTAKRVARISSVTRDSRQSLIAHLMKEPGWVAEMEQGKGPNSADASSYLEALRDVPLFEVSGRFHLGLAADAMLDCLAGLDLEPKPPGARFF